jgi:alcohol dehydrogenase class IV
LRSPLLLPKLAVVDPDLLVGRTKADYRRQRHDALSQLIEPLLSQRANPFTDAWPGTAIGRSARSLRRAYQEGMEDPAYAKTSRSPACSAGECLANSGLGAVHGLAAAAGRDCPRRMAPYAQLCSPQRLDVICAHRRTSACSISRCSELLRSPACLPADRK